jgi:hypothetical protein
MSVYCPCSPIDPVIQSVLSLCAHATYIPWATAGSVLEAAESVQKLVVLVWPPHHSTIIDKSVGFSRLQAPGFWNPTRSAVPGLTSLWKDSDRAATTQPLVNAVTTPRRPRQLPHQPSNHHPRALHPQFFASECPSMHARPFYSPRRRIGTFLPSQTAAVPDSEKVSIQHHQLLYNAST